MPPVEGTFVKIANDTYELVFPEIRPGKHTRKNVPKQQRDPNKRYCLCGRVLRITNRRGICSICRDNLKYHHDKL